MIKRTEQTEPNDFKPNIPFSGVYYTIILEVMAQRSKFQVSTQKLLYCLFVEPKGLSYTPKPDIVKPDL